MKGNNKFVLGGLIVLYFGVTPIYGPVTLAADGDMTAISSEIESQRNLPVRGVTSKSVLENYGEPATKTEPVGDPPISTWFYENFYVYFERELVITTVSVNDRLPTALKDIQ